MTISIPLVLNSIEKAEKNIKECDGNGDKYSWIVFIMYVAISYILSLRVNEGFLLDLDGLNQFWTRNDESYFIVCLLGKIKGESIERRHIILWSNVTSSSIKVKSIVNQLRTTKDSVDFKNGPAVSYLKGTIYLSSEINGLLISVLEELFDE